MVDDQLENYLTSLRSFLEIQIPLIADLEKVPAINNYQQILKILEEIDNFDKEIRQKNAVSFERLRSFREVLDGARRDVESELENLIAKEKKEKKDSRMFSRGGDIDIYIYLFNFDGSDNETWQRMISESALSVYIINRPIFTDKEKLIDNINNHKSSDQHAFLQIKINPESIQKVGESEVRIVAGKKVLASDICCFYHQGKMHKVFDGKIQF